MRKTTGRANVGYSDTRNDCSLTRFDFDSWGEMIDFAQNRKTVWDDDTCASRKQSSLYDRFTLCENLAGAVKLALCGWPEGSKMVHDITAKLVDKITSFVEQPEIMYDVTGEDFDMGLYTSGAPEHWMRTETHIQDGVGKKHLRVVFNYSASGGVGTNALQLKGAAIASMIQALELSGIRCELVTVDTSVQDTQAYENYVTLKHFNQPLDIDRVIFAMGHPAMLRRIGFAVQEGCEEWCSNYHGSYGCPYDVEDKNKGDLYIAASAYNMPDWNNADSVVKWALATMKAQGVAVSIPD